MNKLKQAARKINWKIVNLAFWVELLLAYLMPLARENAAGQAGFPLPFLTVYENHLGPNLFSSVHVSAGALLADVIALYFLLLGGQALYKWLGHSLKSLSSQKQNNPMSTQKES